MHRQTGRQRGFTLIEVLIAMAVFSLLMTGVFTLYSSNSSAFNRSLSKAESRQNARIALDSLARELRMAGHLMGCELCREPSISLWERVREKADPAAFVQRYSCQETRNVLFRHLEEGRPLADAAITHLRECIGCADHFLEPGKALHTLAVDEEAAAAQD